MRKKAMKIFFHILCLYLLHETRSILVGLFIQSNIQHFLIEELLSIVPWLQQTDWMVCLARTEAVFDQNFFNEVHRRNGRLWLSPEKLDKLCAFQTAISRNAEEYLLLVLDRQLSTVHIDIKDVFVVHQFESNNNLYFLRYLYLQGNFSQCVQNESIPEMECIKQFRSQHPNLFTLRNLSQANHSQIHHPSIKENKSRELAQSYHGTRDIQLWWPLNHSEIFIHRQVPHHLSPLRLKQKFIFVFPQYNVSPVSHQIEIRWKDYRHNRASSFTLHQILIDTNSLSRIHNPTVIESTIDYFYSPAENTEMRVKLLDIEIFDVQSSQLLATFPIQLTIVYGTDHWMSTPMRNLTQKQQTCALSLHPMVGQLDSRDDLGFALSSILPNATRMVEVGVNNGYFAQLLLETWDTLHTYIGVDPWKTWSEEEYYDIANVVDQRAQNQNYFNTKMRLAPYGERVMLIRKTSYEAAKIIAEESIDVVYIDAQHHYTAVMEDMNLWWPKIRPGGLLCGHDHLLDVVDNTIFTVKPAVEEFARKHHLLLLQTYDDMKPSYPTWMLFKPLC